MIRVHLNASPQEDPIRRTVDELEQTDQLVKALVKKYCSQSHLGNDARTQFILYPSIVSFHLFLLKSFR